MQQEFSVSQDFKRIVTIRKYAEPNKFELKIQSKWSGAKNPDDLQNEFQWVTTAEELAKLQQFIADSV